MEQLLLEPRTWGGRRSGAGRKRKNDRGVDHRRREAGKNLPAHVTLKVARDLPSLRRPALFRVLLGIIEQSARPGFAVTQFSVMRDHIHLLVEAADTDALSRGMRSF